MHPCTTEAVKEKEDIRVGTVKKMTLKVQKAMGAFPPIQRVQYQR